VLRKSKPESIKAGGLRNLGVAGALAAVFLACTASATARPVAAAVRLSTDTLTSAGGQHATEVEPHAAFAGSTVVSVFQVGRFVDGGAAAIGFSTSTDAGRTWRSGILPSLTDASSPPGTAGRATDTAVAFDSVNGRWLAESLTLADSSTAVVVSGSSDGLSWEAPVTVTSHPRPSQGNEGTNLDKSWITCDNGAASAFRGRCYVVYTDFAQQGVNIGVQSTSDGGRTWSGPAFVRVSVDVPGVQPVVRPNGQLMLVFLDRPGTLYAVRSSDGGASFGARQVITRIQARVRRARPTVLRVFPLPSTTVDGSGVVYVAWSDCRYRPRCPANDVVISHSSGTRWTKPQRLRVPGTGASADHVLPSLGADPASRGARARLALTFYTLRAGACAESRCLLDVRMATSTTAGRRWTLSPRLNPRPMRLPWLASTSSGRMVGDYVASGFSGNRAIGVFALAAAPRGGRLDEAIHAVVRVVR
jgi:hypothetical protein